MRLWPALTPALKVGQASCLPHQRVSASLAAAAPLQAGKMPALPLPRAFTLIELLLVMALLLIVLAVSFPSLRGFFRGRHLDHEARRFLSLTRYAQSRAVSEGYPMVLWIDAKQRAYGMQAQTGYLDEDDKSVEYEIHETLELEVTRPLLVRVTATQRNESASVAGSLPTIRFTPDGFYTDSSLERIVIRQGSETKDRDEDEVVIAKSENRLGYEIQTSNEQITRR
jgi:type II secretion system protein H